MKRERRTYAPLTAVIASATATGAHGASVDVQLGPIEQTSAVCTLVEVEIRVASDDVVPQPFDGLDAILAWDETILELIGISDAGAGASWFISDFLPDPDGVNDDLDDGDAIYTALAAPGDTIAAPPAPSSLLVTTILFRAIDYTPVGGTPVSLTSASGTFGVTQVVVEGAVVTGDTSAIATANAGTCFGDIDVNGEVRFEDLIQVLSWWGPCPTDCCPQDVNLDGLVGFLDLIFVLSFWGPCP